MSNLNRHPVRRAAVGVLAGTLAFTGGAFAAGISPANAVEGFTFDRLEGGDRYATAVQIAQDAFPAGSDTALLARGDVFADALAGNYLAGVVSSPILLTDTDQLPQSTEDGLEALGVETVYILGGFSAVSAAVEAELNAAGYAVERLSGTDRYFTAERIAQEAAEQGGATAVGEHNGLRTAILASGQNFPDALAGGAISYAEQFPLTLTRPTDLPAQTEDVLTDLNIEQVIVVGGTTAVSEAVRTEVENLTGNPLIELDGVDRWATAAEIADFAITELGFTDEHVNLARADSPTGFADALSGGPHAGGERAPIVLTFPNDLPNATAAWLEANSDTLVDGHIFGGFAAVSAAVEAEAEELADGGVPAEATVTVTPTGGDTTITAGENFVGTLTAEGENITGVTVSGPCVTDGAVTETGTPGGEEFGFSIPVNNDAAAGSCSLTFSVSIEGQDDPSVVTQTITVERPASATVRPELTSAAVGATTTPTNATPANPAGTLVTYTFDEQVVGGTTQTGGSPVAAQFFVYNTANGTPVDAGDAIVSVNGNQVVVRFNAITDATAAAALTVATVNDGAVTDTQGLVNPEGDAAIGSAGGGNTSLPAGVTVAPDLVSVGNFRQASTIGRTAVDFTFDEAATTTDLGGFHLILINNPGTTTTAGANDIECAGPASGDGTVAGGTVAGGNGTTVITVICDNPGGTPGTVAGTALTADQVARGTVEENTVAETTDNDTTNATNDENVEQAVDVSNGGNTFEPDLVSVSFTQGTGTTNDSAVFTFDQAVQITNPNAFFAYGVDAEPIAGTATQTNGTAGTGAGTQVLVTFPSQTSLDGAVGGFVTDGAVTVPATATTTALPNEQDEVGVANTQANAAQTPGRTAGPDLTAVALSQATGPFGPGDYRATYTFDEDIADPSAITTDTSFYLFLADGTRLTADNCVVGTTEDTDNTVVCDSYTGFPAGTTESAAIGSATLGTVDRGAVFGTGTATTVGGVSDGVTNPEGAEFTTGGTGTRTA